MTRRRDSPFSEPTICDMNCFYERGHEGPHQKWLGDPCDAEGCENAAKWRRGREVFCDDHTRQKAEPSPTAETAVLHIARAEAMCRLLIDSGDMTPTAHRQLRKLWGGRATDV